MQLTQDTNTGKYYIHAYVPGRIKVNEETFANSIIVAPDQLINPWHPLSVAELTAEDFAPIIALQPEIVLLGTGVRLSFPAQNIFAALYAKQIGVEVMDTGAACRTYNVLMSEGRRAVAALLIR